MTEASLGSIMIGMFLFIFEFTIILKDSDGLGNLVVILFRAKVGHFVFFLMLCMLIEECIRLVV